MIKPIARPFSDGEELGQMMVEEGSRPLGGDPRERAIEARRQAGDPISWDEPVPTSHPWGAAAMLKGRGRASV